MKGAGGKNSWDTFSVVINRDRPWRLYRHAGRRGAGT